MLLVVSKTGGLQRVILRTGTYDDVGEDDRFGFVLGQIDGETIVKGVDTCLHGVTRNRLIRILFRREAKGCGDERQKYKNSLHRHRFY